MLWLYSDYQRNCEMPWQVYRYLCKIQYRHLDLYADIISLEGHRGSDKLLIETGAESGLYLPALAL